MSDYIGKWGSQYITTTLIYFRYDIEDTFFNTERILPHDEVVSTKGK